MNYAFADFVLDGDRAELRQNGEPVRIEPQVFDLLKLLISSNGRMVPRDEIFEVIWGDRIVSDAALSSRVKDARKALGDDGTTQKFIRTVHRRGLVFTGDVAQSDAPPVATDPVGLAGENRRAMVAVLPFEDFVSPDGRSSLARGLTDELTSVLGFWRTFLVVSGQSMARLPNHFTSAAQIGAFLDADYLIGGSVRQTGRKVKLNVTMTQTATNADVWSDRIVCDLEDLSDVEEDLAARLSTILAVEIQMAEARRIMRKPQQDWTPWDKAMRTISYLRNGKRSDYVAAETLARAACEESPDWGLPFTLVAVARFQMAMAGFSAADTTKAFAPTLKAAEQALDIDRTDWMAHALTGVGELWTNRNFEKALTHVDKAISLNPSAVMNYHFGGCVAGFAGDPAGARKHQEHLFRIDPTYPYRAVIEADLGLWHFLDEEFEQAEFRFERSEAWDPNYGRCWQRRIALFGYIGQRDKAQAAATKLKELGLPVDIDTILTSYPFQLSKHKDMFLHGLRQAGLNL
ncbi:MAG: winged helix-turn-helix domain-containing tetratricopeptide repeat protein [Sedimentitalea sp.]